MGAFLLEMHYALFPMMLNLFHYNFTSIPILLATYAFGFPLASMRSVGHALWYLCAANVADLFIHQHHSEDATSPPPPPHIAFIVLHGCAVMAQMYFAPQYELHAYVLWCVADVLFIFRDTRKALYELGTLLFFLTLQSPSSFMMESSEFIRNLCVFSVLFGLTIYAQKLWEERAIENEPVSDAKEE